MSETVELQNLNQIVEALKLQIREHEEENEALARQLIALKKHFEDQAEEDNGRHRQALAKLQERFDESEALRLTFEKQSLELIRKVHELEDQKATCSVVEDSSEHILALRSQNEGLRQRVTQLHKDLELSEDHRNHLQKQLKEKEACFSGYDREVALIKQSLVRCLRETKELEALHEMTVKEKIAAVQKFQQAHYQMEKMKEQLADVHKQLQEVQTIQQEGQRRLEHMQVQAARQEQNLATKQQEINDFERQLSVAHQELRLLRDDLTRTKSAAKEKENDLLQAQQHLAKKVKEAAQLDERNEELKRSLADLEQWQHQTRVKMAELQTSVDLHGQHQKRLEEKLQESSKSNEAQNSKWEEKYFALYEKLQVAEARTRELEKVEEKQRHLQGLLNNLGTYFSPELPKEPPAAQQPQPVLSSGPKPSYSEPAIKAYPNLFDGPKQAVKVRKSLLE